MERANFQLDCTKCKHMIILEVLEIQNTLGIQFKVIMIKVKVILTNMIRHTTILKTTTQVRFIWGLNSKKLI